jgi:hypothetical protein
MSPVNISPDPADVQTSYSSSEIDLTQLVRAIWRFRVTILLVVAGGVLAGLIVSIYSGRHMSDGLFLTPGLDLPRYKQYEVALSNGTRLRDFAELKDLPEQGSELFEKLASVQGALADTISPAFSITGKQAKSYDIQSTEAGKLIGINIRLASRDKSSESLIHSVAEYLRHTMIEVDLGAAFLGQCIEHRARETELRNELLSSNFGVTQLKERARQLRSIIERVPGSANVDIRQAVVSVEAGRERYLSPMTQLVAVEVEIAEAALADERRDRELVSARLRREYYCRALALQRDHPLGQELLASLKPVHDGVFANEDRSLPIVEQVYNELELERTQWESHYLLLSRFIVAPDGGDRVRRSPGLAIGMVMGGLLGCLFGFFLALALSWWRDHGNDVLVESE